MTTGPEHLAALREAVVLLGDKLPEHFPLTAAQLEEAVFAAKAAMVTVAEWRKLEAECAALEAAEKAAEKSDK